MGWPERNMTGRHMVDVIARMFRRESEPDIAIDTLSPNDRQLMRQAAARARRRLEEAGLLDVEHDAQREIRARVHAA